MFHVGHLRLLQRSKAYCERLIVGVSDDDLVFRLKNRRPVIPAAERMEIVANISCVDEVVPESTVNKIDAWDSLRFDVTFKGDDWQGTPKWNKLEAEFALLGVSVIYLPYTREVSTTMLRDRISQATA